MAGPGAAWRHWPAALLFAVDMVCGTQVDYRDPRLMPLQVAVADCNDKMAVHHSFSAAPWVCRGANAIKQNLHDYQTLYREGKKRATDIGFAGSKKNDDAASDQREVVATGYNLKDEPDANKRGVSSINLKDASFLWDDGKKPPFATGAKGLQTTIWMAKAGLSFKLHFDQQTKEPWHQGFFLFQLFGKKTIRLVDPGLWPVLQLHPWCHDHGMDTQLPDLKGDLMSWDSLCEKFTFLNKLNTSEHGGIFQVHELEPGDMLYIPPAWFHETDATTDTASLRVFPPKTMTPTDEVYEDWHQEYAEAVLAALQEVGCSTGSFLADFLPKALGPKRAGCVPALVLASIYAPAGNTTEVACCCGVDGEEATGRTGTEHCPEKQRRSQPMNRAIDLAADWIQSIIPSSQLLATVAFADTLIHEEVGSDIATLRGIWEVLHEALAPSMGADRQVFEAACLAAELELVRSTRAAGGDVRAASRGGSKRREL